MSIFVDLRFLDRETCRRIRTAMDLGTKEPAEVLHDAAAADRRARDATIIEVDSATLVEVEAALDTRREAISALFGVTLAEREGTAFLRYTTGGFYGPHRDRASLSSWPDAARRRVAVVGFLSECSGGTLRLLDGEPRNVDPREGCLVAFDAALLHEVLPVRAGVRDVIVDWFY